MKSRFSLLRLAGVLACCLPVLLTATQVQAQNWPTRPVRIISPFPPGGANDTISRVLAQQLTGSLGQTVLVENRAGASGMIGTDFVAKSPPDGHTLLMSTPGPITVNPLLVEKIPYDAEKDFTPIARVGTVPSLVVVHPSVPAHNMSELIALAKKRSGQLNFGSAGAGSSTHLAGELLKSMAKIDIVHVPYKGSAPAMNDLLGGQLQILFDTIVLSLPHAQSGRVRALAVTGAKRSSAAPDIPTVAESGVPGYEMITWYGVLGPGGMPAQIVTRLNQEITRALQQPDVRTKLSSMGTDIDVASPEEFAQYLKAERAQWAKVLKESGTIPK
jgi:tripartite-type tricarboxylate transporter receptor subunit TctC